MSAALRFLAVAVVGWAAIRAASIGVIPGAEAFTVAKAQPAPPPIVPTVFPPIEPVQAQGPGPAGPFVPAGYPGAVPYAMVAAGRAAGPAYYYYVPGHLTARALAAAAPAAIPGRQFPYSPPLGSEAAPEFYAPIPQLDQWSLASIASPAGPRRSSSQTTAIAALAQAIPQRHLDRLQLSAWALVRREPGTGGLASGGTLGGSQAGARLTYAFNRQIAASLRSSSPVGSNTGGDVAAGVRLTPFRSIPVALTAERRQAIGRFSTGRSDFALFLEGGVYQQPLPWGLALDAYGQAGVVGVQTRDLFADGGFTVLRPIFGPVSAGLGAWGGVQPGLYRVDAGPRVSMRLRRNMRVDLDWRQRLAGEALPSSGPAVTLAADF